MGVYLSSPITDKHSVDETCNGFVYGASSMQGWRVTQEDAHNCIPVFDEESKTSFFAVYDGHGGSEVAQYCESHFPKFIKKMMEQQGGIGNDPTTFIQNAFLDFDASLTTHDVAQELRDIAGYNEMDFHDEEIPVGRTETDLLKEEANIPLDQLLAQYKSNANDTTKDNQNTNNSQSPALAAKAGSSSCNGEDMFKNSPQSCSSSSNQESAESSLESNGTHDLNSNNTVQSESPLELSDKVNSNSPDGDCKSVTENKTDNAKNCGSQHLIKNKQTNLDDNECVSSSSQVESTSVAGKTTENAVESSSLAEDSSSTSVVGNSSMAGESSVNAVGSSTDTGESSSDCAGSSSSTTAGNSSSAAGSSNEAEPSSSGLYSNPGVRKSKAKAAAEMALLDGEMDTSDEDDDDEDEDDDEEGWEDMSDSEDDDEDDEDEVKEVKRKGDGSKILPWGMAKEEEPGSDSGCTACVVFLQGKKIIVANAGDSRCVLSRAGKAVELSFDHKPEDDSEKSRIEKAGGKVTQDGRVNGGLNLSRAIGDHVYKQNKDLPAKEQMITALPDIEMAELCDDDQFIVIACDGIWNYLSSQDVVDYILEKLKDPEKRKKPSLICEELFDHCLAPNTYGDGTGCDNMTCIIIVLDTYTNTNSISSTEAASDKKETISDVNTDSPSSKQNKTDDGNGSDSLKRCLDTVEVSEGKRLKLQEEIV
ncbi:probable protein phosphatase CG10417 isoform X2 [Physella acuta]|uniref:probable protein phosphatase CG10417 isoform X2 n=1 Tax=Physella acuta TaxID=109671 RepID=UPI0027DD0135|nr:probable protein phosphatase CG10417 isoform X2 [Physella acuta]